MCVLNRMVAIALVGVLAAAQGFSQDTAAGPQVPSGQQADKAQAKGNVAATEDAEPQVTAERPTSFWMAKKLDYSKSLLEALTSGDFEGLQDDATKMSRLAKIEGFVRRKNPDYRAQMVMFESATQELIRQAKRHNAEGAGLAFNHLTNSCVACHVLLREGIE